MHKIAGVLSQKRNRCILLLLQVMAVIVFAIVAAATFTPRELTFEEGDMQIKNHDGSIVDGNYMDISYTDGRAVVTPAFGLAKGIYYIEAEYLHQGIINAGLLYDVPRNGKELVDDDEFVLNPEKQAISYRVQIHDDSQIRFKLRLTGDAVEGDYVQLMRVHIISSKLTYVYQIFWLFVLLLLVDLLIWGYARYYVRWGVERKVVFLVLAITSFFLGLPLYHSGLNNGVDLAFHLSRIDGLYKSMKFVGLGGGQKDSSLLGYNLDG